MHARVGPEIGIRIGEVIADKYRVDRVLGVGGMGVVVAAHHLQLEELVAIKVLLPEALADADAVRRFEREARAAFKIKSQHGTRIIDVGTLENGAPFIVMEYLEGEDLADRIARTGALPVEEAIELLLQACEALAEAHALGIVHRDLKPGNLFCVRGADARPAIKVLDFGISKLTGAETHGAGLGMTKTRAMMGSPYYMSPEQMQSPRTVDARTDIWSLGVVLYQVLSGEVPFNGETLPQVCVNVATQPAPSLRKIRPDVPIGLEMIVLRCLEKDVGKRFSTVSALATALARFGSKRAQTSLDRIVRTSPQEEQHDPDGADARYTRATDRPVTGPLPTWGGTAKSRNGRSKSLVGWVAASLIVGSAGFTFAVLQSWRDSTEAPAVLITPMRAPEPREMAVVPPSSQSLPVAVPGAGGEPPAATPAAPASASIAMPAAPSAVPSPPEIERPAPGPAPEKLPAAYAPPLNQRPLSPPAPPVADTEGNPYTAEPAAPTALSISPTCLLNLNSLPPARVLLDGRPLGFTPKIGVVVPAGEHRVLFRWEDADKHASVTCAKGEAKTVAVRLYEAPADEDRLERNPYR